MFWLLGFMVATFILWRAWRFTLSPLLRPTEPKELPYWIPFLGESSWKHLLRYSAQADSVLCFPGHAIAFFKDSHGTLTRGRTYFGDTREPYALTIAGQKLYILTSPNDVAAAYKNTVSLTFDEYIRDMMFQFGGSKDGIEKMWTKPHADGSGRVLLNPNPHQKCLAHLGEDFYRQQLYPGKILDDLQLQFMPNIHAALRFDSIATEAILSTQGAQKTVSLLRWTRNVLLNAATTSFFGDRLLQIEPSLFQKFFDFDDNSWKLTYHLPRMFATEMYAAKEQATEALLKYFSLPREERQGETWLVRTLESEMRHLDIEEKDIASFIMMIYWVINGNAYKLCFWVLAHLLHDPKLLAEIREEINPVVLQGTTELESRLERCPRLESVYNEVLRLTASSSSVRNVDSTTELRGKRLQSGTKVLIPYRQLHLNRQVWGDDAENFDPYRFLNNKDLARSSCFRPFGGGTTYCPGRFLAKREVMTFVALVIYRFNVQLSKAAARSGDGSNGQDFPSLEIWKPCLGIMGPVLGHDVLIDVSPAT